MLKLRNHSLALLCCALTCGLPLAATAQEAQSAPRTVTQETGTEKDSLTAVAVPAAELPDSPGSLRAQSQDAAPPSDSSKQPATPAQKTATDQDQNPQRPVGTAAAEAPKVSGITAAEPAGIAIAPAKQRRTRTIVIKVAAIVAAGAALGTVIALSEATSSKPPGAH